jgi:DNA (cytosine-5)-methyltransferase 1
MNELALFAGAGGGILGGHLLGWRTVCAVEWEPYPASVLLARQNDEMLPPFPVWDDIQTFDGRPWRGIVDVVSGGFPCQDISAAGGGAGIDGERSAECGEKWHGSFTKYDPDSSLWKTHQCSLLEDLESFSETWPRWGLMRSGECWEQQTLAHRTSETEFGFLPTPTAHNAKETNAPSEALRNEPTLASRVGGKLNPMWVEWLMGWPLGWTDLKPLETDKFQRWLDEHGKS